MDQVLNETYKGYAENPWITSTSKPTPIETWTYDQTLIAIPLALIVVLTILGNFLALYCFFTRKNTLRQPTHFLIANLALADFLVGVFVMPFLATLQVTGKWYFGSCYCEAWTVIHFWLCSASILSTCAVCVERYVVVRYPLDHDSLLGRKRVWAVIAVVWVLAGVLTLTSLYIWPEPKSGKDLHCEINQQIGHVIVAVVGILYVPAGIMIVLYWRIFVIVTSKELRVINKKRINQESSSSGQYESGIVKFFNRSMQLLTGAPASEISTITTSTGIETETTDSHVEIPLGQSEMEKSKTIKIRPQNKYQVTLAKRLSMLVGILLASYLPFFTLYMVMAIHPGSIDMRVFSAFGWIRYFNSCINPVIYAFAVPPYRKAMVDVLERAFRRVGGGYFYSVCE